MAERGTRGTRGSSSSRAAACSPTTVPPSRAWTPRCRWIAWTGPTSSLSNWPRTRARRRSRLSTGAAVTARRRRRIKVPRVPARSPRPSFLAHRSTRRTELPSRLSAIQSPPGAAPSAPPRPACSRTTKAWARATAYQSCCCRPPSPSPSPAAAADAADVADADFVADADAARASIDPPPSMPSPRRASPTSWPPSAWWRTIRQTTERRRPSPSTNRSPRRLPA